MIRDGPTSNKSADMHNPSMILGTSQLVLALVSALALALAPRLALALMKSAGCIAPSVFGYAWICSVTLPFSRGSRIAPSVLPNVPKLTKVVLSALIRLSINCVPLTETCWQFAMPIRASATKTTASLFSQFIFDRCFGSDD